MTRYFFVDYENVNHDGLNGITRLTEKDCVRIYYSKSAETLTFGLHRRINASRARFDYIKVQVPIKNAVDCQILFDIRDMAKENRDAEYIIVSNDKDFDKAIEEFKGHNLNVKKVLEICRQDEPAKKEKKESAKKESSKKEPKKKKSGENTAEKAPEGKTSEAKTPKPKASRIKTIDAQNSGDKIKTREEQVRTFFGQHFKKKIYRDHRDEIIQAVLKGATKQQVNNNLMQIYNSETVSEIYKKIQPLIKELPGK